MPSKEMVPLIFMEIEMLSVLRNVSVELRIKPAYKVIDCYLFHFFLLICRKYMIKRLIHELFVPSLLLSLDPYQPSLASRADIGVSDDSRIVMEKVMY